MSVEQRVSHQALKTLLNTGSASAVVLSGVGETMTYHLKVNYTYKY